MTAAPRAELIGRSLRWVLLVLSLALAGVVGLVLPYLSLLLAAVAAVYLVVTGGRATFRVDAAAVLFAAAFLSLAIAYALSAERPADILFALNFIYLLFFIPFISLYRLSQSLDPARRVADLALLGSLLMLLLAGVEMVVFSAPRVGYLSTDPIRYGAAALILGFLSLIGLQLDRGRRGWWYLLGPLAAFVVILMTGSRGAVIAYAVIAMAAILMLSRRRLLALSVVAVLLAVAIVVIWTSGIVGAARLASLVEIARQMSAGEEVTDPALAVRLDLYQAGIRSFLDSPLVGHGWSRLTEAPQQYIRTDILISKHAHLHSDLLNFAVAGGLFGVLAYVLILAAPLAAVLRSPRDRYFAVRLYGCVVLFGAYFLLGSTSLMLGFEYPTALYVCMAALLLGFCRDSAPAEPKRE